MAAQIVMSMDISRMRKLGSERLRNVTVALSNSVAKLLHSEADLKESPYVMFMARHLSYRGFICFLSLRGGLLFLTGARP